MIAEANQIKVTPYTRVQLEAIHLLGPRLNNGRNGLKIVTGVGHGQTVTGNMTAHHNKIAQLPNPCREQHVNACVGNVDRNKLDKH